MRVESGDVMVPRPRRRTAFWVVAALALSSTPAWASHDRAGGQRDGLREGPAAAPVGAELVLLHGTNDGSGIDPRLGKIPALSKPPFSAFDSYHLLRKETLQLAPNQATTTKLPNKADLAVTFQGLTSPKKNEPKKYVVNLNIQRKGSSVLPLLQINATPGETLFAAIPGFKGGVLVIGIKIVP